jgi:hypothetical protein
MHIQENLWTETIGDALDPKACCVLRLLMEEMASEYRG